MSEETAKTNNEITPLSSDLPLSETSKETLSLREGNKSPCSDESMLEPNRLQFVYAVGKVDFRFPSRSLEKELIQVIGTYETKGLTDRQAIHFVLSKTENRYITRMLCWTFSVSSIDTYILTPRTPDTQSSMIAALRPEPRPTDLDLLIGIRGTIAKPTLCNGLVLPVVVYDQIYSFDYDSLFKAIPRHDKTKQFTDTAHEVLTRIIQMTDNAGATDEHRALNYLAVRYPTIYEKAVECFRRNCSLSAIEVRTSDVSTATTKILDVIFSFTNRTTDVVEKYFVRVDVSERFPFLITKLTPYYDH